MKKAAKKVETICLFSVL